MTAFYAHSVTGTVARYCSSVRYGRFGRIVSRWRAGAVVRENLVVAFPVIAYGGTVAIGLGDVVIQLPARLIATITQRKPDDLSGTSTQGYP